MSIARELENFSWSSHINFFAVFWFDCVYTDELCV